MAELHSKRALNVTLIIISQMFPSNSEWMPKKTHRHSCNYNLIGCECHLCEGLRREGVNALCPPATPIPHARNLHPGYHNAIPQPLLSSLRKTHLCSRPITHAWDIQSVDAYVRTYVRSITWQPNEKRLTIFHGYGALSHARFAWEPRY